MTCHLATCQASTMKLPTTQVGASLSLANLTSTGSISVLRGDPLTVTQTMEGDGTSLHTTTITTTPHQHTPPPEPVVHVSYEDLTARVVRGDIRCSNGYIHLVDKVGRKGQILLVTPDL